MKSSQNATSTALLANIQKSLHRSRCFEILLAQARSPTTQVGNTAKIEAKANMTH